MLTSLQCIAKVSVFLLALLGSGLGLGQLGVFKPESESHLKSTQSIVRIVVQPPHVM